VAGRLAGCGASPIPDSRPDRTLEDVGQLVLIAVDMGVNENAGLDGVFNDGKTATSKLTAT
jgi:hypothetical protein